MVRPLVVAVTPVSMRTTLVLTRAMRTASSSDSGVCLAGFCGSATVSGGGSSGMGARPSKRGRVTDLEGALFGKDGVVGQGVGPSRRSRRAAAEG